ncbi:MaoC/PaaZ C-terminal domain-containing protein [Porticoccaceae bacterium]|nr:MaoC/PaaZ C-terminal domain-containing protein [Porticoccaceae bacterium]
MNKYTISNIAVGSNESFKVFVAESKMDMFLGITNDVNPLHINAEYAVQKGFRGRVVYGLLTSAYYSTLVGVYLPGRYCILQGLDIKFSKPVYIGDELNIYGEVTYINEAYKQVEIKATITNQDNIRVSKATIKVGVMDE